MGPSGEWLAADDSGALAAFKALPVSDRPLPFLLIHRAVDRLSLIAVLFAEEIIDRAFVFGDDAVDKGEIELPEGALFKKGDHFLFGLGRFRQDESAGGLFIKAVDELQVALDAQTIFQRFGIRHQTGGLIYDEKFPVFIEDENFEDFDFLLRLKAVSLNATVSLSARV